MKYRLIYINIFLLFIYTNIMAQTTLEREWIREYTGVFELQDARAIAVDDSGNVIVGITSFDTISSYGFTTIKYNPAGEMQWIAKYEGPFVPDTSKSKDYVQDITADYDNNIYVAGRSLFLQSDPYEIYTTFVTIKYNSNGEEQWIARFRIDSLGTGWYWSYKIAVDEIGQVYVYGIYGTGILIKYDSLGNELWTQPIESGTLESEFRLFDNSIYVGSDTFTVMKYDTSGNLIWHAENDSLNIDNKAPGDIAVDFDGNVYISSLIRYDYNTDFLLAKFNNSGNFQWAKTYGGQLYYHYWNPIICIDDNGFVYLGGYVIVDFSNDEKFITIKYDSSGNEIWVETCDGPPNTWAKLWNMGIDNLSNIYIIGHVTDYSTNNSDLALVQYDSDGNMLFSDFYGTLNRNEEASKIAIDHNNNVYLTGDNYFFYFTEKNEGQF